MKQYNKQISGWVETKQIDKETKIELISFDTSQFAGFMIFGQLLCGNCMPRSLWKVSNILLAKEARKKAYFCAECKKRVKGQNKREGEKNDKTEKNL